jgi:hypothetical protein
MIINNAFSSKKSHIFTIFFINQSIEQLKMRILKNISLAILVTGYLWRAPIILSIRKAIIALSRLLTLPGFIKYTGRFFEILFALLMIRPKTRKVASYGIILMLIAFYLYILLC